MDSSIHEKLVKFATSSFEKHPLLLGLTGDGVLKFCGVSLSEEPRSNEDDDDGNDFEVGTVLCVRTSFIAGGAFLTINTEFEVQDGENIGDAVNRIFGGEA